MPTESDLAATAPAPTAGSRALRARPHWADVLLVWAACSLLSLVILRLSAHDAPATAWAGASPSWREVLTFWDSGWYERIITEGYPTTLPVDASGTVQQNAWAFLPMLPYLAQALVWLGGSFAVRAAAVAALSSAGAAVALDRWLAPRTGERASLWAVALLWSSPCAVVLQVPYAESLGLLLVALALGLAQRGRYRAAAPFVLLAPFARPLGAPLALALGLWWLWELASRRGLLRGPTAQPGQAPAPASPSRATTAQPASRGEGASRSAAAAARQGAASPQGAPAPSTGSRGPHGLLALALLAGAATAAWPLAAWAVTGRPDAYTATETAWRGSSLAPFLPWLERGGWWVGAHLGPLLLVAVLAVGWLALSAPSLRALGPAARLWCLAYTAYLLAVFDPTTSLLRLLLPLAPAAWALASSTGRRARLLLLAAGVIGQLLWVSWVWTQAAGVTWVP